MRKDWLCAVFLPLVQFQLHAVVFHPDPVRFQPLTLRIESAEGIVFRKFPLGIDYFVAGILIAIRIPVENITDSSCQVGVAQVPGNLPVGYDPSVWNAGEMVIDCLAAHSVFHIASFPVSR